MTTLLIILLCIAAVLLIISQYMQKSFKKSRMKISFKESINLIDLPVVTMNIQGRAFNFLIDSGGDQSYINEADLDNLEYMATQSKKRVISALGEVECATCELDLEYKGHCFPVTFYIADFSESFNKVKEDSGILLNGILGTSFLVKYKYVLDFANLLMFSKK